MSVNECRVYFALDGMVSCADEVTALIGLEPTDIIDRGESQSWQLSSDEVIEEDDMVLDIYKLADTVGKQLIPVKEQIVQAIETYNLEPKLQLVLWLTTDEHRSLPIFGFNEELIQTLAYIGAFIDIDTYLNP